MAVMAAGALATVAARKQQGGQPSKAAKQQGSSRKVAPAVGSKQCKQQQGSSTVAVGVPTWSLPLLVALGAKQE